MGFDIHVTLSLHICEITGKPYYFATNPETGHIEKKLGAPEVEVPQEFRNYLSGRGSIFHAYTEYFNETDHYDVCVEDFLAHYPSWEEVLEHPNYDDEWTKKDHEGFEDLLAWCSGQDVVFRVTWSY